MSFSYSKNDFKNGLINCGIKNGDKVFCHSNIGFFGFLEEADSIEKVCSDLLEVITDVIGSNGTIVVPSFSYSFGNDKKEKVYDVELTPAKNMGFFSEFVRNHIQSYRSLDPMFSVSAIGKDSKALVENVSNECFGTDSFWDRFLRESGKICNFNFDSGSTLIHHIEKKINVSYRDDKPFSGEVILDKKKYPKTVIYFCRDLTKPELQTNFEIFDKYAKRIYAKTSTVGRGSIVTISAKETENLIIDTIKNEPYFLTNK